MLIIRLPSWTGDFLVITWVKRLIQGRICWHLIGTPRKSGEGVAKGISALAILRYVASFSIILHHSAILHLPKEWDTLW